MKSAVLAAAILSAVVTGNLTVRYSDVPANWSGPVCRSVAEDSTLTSCNYADGMWFQNQP